MEKLKEILIARGVSREALDNMDEAKIVNLASAFSISKEFFPRKKPTIETGKNGAQYVITDTFVVPKYQNKRLVEKEQGMAKNLYIRFEAIPQAIADLQEALRMFGKK